MRLRPWPARKVVAHPVAYPYRRDLVSKRLVYRGDYCSCTKLSDPAWAQDTLEIIM